MNPCGDTPSTGADVKVPSTRSLRSIAATYTGFPTCTSASNMPSIAYPLGLVFVILTKVPAFMAFRSARNLTCLSLGILGAWGMSYDNWSRNRQNIRAGQN